MIDAKLITFITLLEEKSYTKTAKKLYITQPAVTHHIKSLEKEYEITIFSNTKNFDLTKDGKILYEYAKYAKYEDEQLRNNLKNSSDTEVLNIAYTNTIADCPIASGLINNIKNYSTKINPYILNYNDIEKRILNGQLDFGFIDNSFDSSNFDSITLSHNEIILVCKNGGAFDGKERITRDQLMQSIIVTGDEEGGLFRSFIQSMKNKNIRLKNTVVLKASNINLLVNLIDINDGIGFVYESSVKDLLEKSILRKIELLNFSASQNFYLIYNRRNYLSEKKMMIIDYLKKYKEE